MDDERGKPVDRLDEAVRAVLSDNFIRKVARITQHYWDMPEDLLAKELIAGLHWKKYFQTYKRVRISFWNEIDEAIAESRKATVWRIYDGGLVNRTYFSNQLRDIPALLPWLLHRPTAWNIKLRELSELAEERLLEILAVTPVREVKSGDETIEVVDSKLAKVQADIFEMIQDRLRGGVVQTVNQNQKQLSVHMNANDMSRKQLAESHAALDSMEKILKRLAEVTQKRKALNAALQAPQVIDQKKLMRPDILEE